MKNYWEKLGILSFDLEAESLDPLIDQPHKGIWSIGAKNSNGKEAEYFIDQHRNASDAISRLRASSTFNEEQFAKGYFNNYEKAIQSGNIHSVESALKDVFGSIDKNGAVLIQNLNFENKMVASVLDGMDSEESKKIREMFRYRETSGSNRILFRPPKVKEELDAASIAFDSFLERGNNQDWDTTLKHYRGMMGEYQKEFTSGNSGLFAIDLMDITKATQAEAANAGYLDRRMIGTGTKVDFLSRTLFGEAEEHTALSDAKLQERIFGRLMGIREELASGSVSEDTKLALARMRIAQPDDAKRMFIESVNRASSDIDTYGHTRINLSEFRRGVGNTVIDVDGPNGIEKIRQPQYARINTAKEGEGYGIYKTSNKQTALEDVLNRFSGRDTGDFNKEEYVRRVLNGGTAESIKEAEESIVNKIESKTTVGIEDRAKVLISKASSKFNALTKWQKGGIIGAGILSTLAILNSGDSLNEEEIKKRTQSKKNSLNEQMKTFKGNREQLIYHGTGIQNWKERKKHHQY